MPGGTPVFALKELVARLQREQYKIQDLLSSLGFTLRSLNNISQFLELIPMIASRVTDATGGALVLFRPNGQLRLERLYCPANEICQTVRYALESATRQITSSLSVSLSDKGADGEPMALNHQAARSAMVTLDQQLNHFLAPDLQVFGTSIIVQNVERGRLYVFSDDADYTWTETRQKLVRLVADQTAVAIENDELTLALRKKERLDRELELGAEIQEKLLPRQCPVIEGLDLAAQSQTAQKVGGDYYDFIPTTHDQLHSPTTQLSSAQPWRIAIGDVMGKGVPAGLIMTMLRGMLRAEVLNDHSPGQILQNINSVMHNDLESSNRFVTLFYAEYDPKTQVFSYGNAAHNPPLLWEASTDTISRLDADGMLLGLDTTTRYHEGQVQLSCGDVVVFYTDGFTDAANIRGERFDEENLIKAVCWACRNLGTSQEILDYLFNLLRHFIGPDRSKDDDTTLVVMKVTQPAEFLQLSAIEESGFVPASSPVRQLSPQKTSSSDLST